MSFNHTYKSCNSTTNQIPILLLPSSSSSSMAVIPKVIIFVALLVVVHGVQASSSNGGVAGAPNSLKIDCGGACAERCKLSGRPNLCKRACGSCCDKCNCVPPGTYGNYEACPCYAKLTTRDNKPKCP